MISTEKVGGLITKLLFVVMMGSASMAMAAPLSLPSKPLYLGGTADANVMFTIDDSGSMNWSVLPESLRMSIGRYATPSSGNWQNNSAFQDFYDESNNTDVLKFHSADNNTAYYDPEINYTPWYNSDGTLWPNASTTCTRYNPNNTTCQDLASQITTSGGDTYWPATYFVYSTTGSRDAITGAPNAPDWTDTAMYTKVEIRPGVTSYTNVGGRADCAGSTTCTYAEELQNFVNWFSYYRTRLGMAKAGIGKAFSAQGSDMRVGYASINTGWRNVDGVSGRNVIDGVRQFSGTDRTAWFNRLYAQTASGGTPLRRAVDRVGRYFQRSDNPGPWGNDPGVNDATAHAECRPAFNILMTDGFWNSYAADTSAARANVDGINGPTITTPTAAQYIAGPPYEDGTSNTLADVAMYYWNRDLRTDLGNFVPTGTQNTAYWQHMVNFTVGLGVTGTLDPTTTAAAIAAGTDPGWPSPFSGSDQKVDDLWHAAVNSRGKFFSVKDPDTFASALSAALNNIVSMSSTSAAVALSATSLSTGVDVYVGEFNSGDWTGQLKALPVSDGSGVTAPVACHALPRGTVCEDQPRWDASTVLTDSLNGDATFYDTGRKIVTYKPSQKNAIAFRWPTNPASPTATELDPSQILVLRTDPDNGTTDSNAIGSDRLDYLRGRDITGFRARTNYLGDIVYSAPAFVGAPNSRYPDNWAGATVTPEDSAPYSNFKSVNSSRAKRIYVAANDGMLHAFDDADGSEVFAYIPSTSFGIVDVPNLEFGRLNQLTSTIYDHRYFVDGSPIVLDAFFDDGGGTAAWRTVLAAGLRSGGHGVYALDVTSPAAADESAAAAKVLWEFTDNDDVDIGFTFGDPSIVRMNNGRWAVVVSNGYNNSVADGNASATGNAVLFILFLDADLSDGTWNLGTDYIKMDTGAGSVATPNGLAAPAVVDVNGDVIADYIYAGDLQGNMWKFDVSDAAASNWGIAFGTGAVPVPLFTATDDGGVAQPITTRPQIGNHETQKDSYMVFFGTGKYLEPSDNLVVAQQTQAYYGVWDKNGEAGGATGSAYAAFSRTALLKQEIVVELFAASGYKYRGVSNNVISWHNTAGLPTGTPITTHLGWYLDLLNVEGGNTDNAGERQVTDSVLRKGKIIFTTLLPSVDPCEFGGNGWTMDISPINGGPLFDLAQDSPFDVNEDGDFSTADWIQMPYDVNGDGVVDANDKAPAAGTKRDIGILSKVKILKDGDQDDLEYKIVTGSSGQTIRINEASGFPISGRKTWRQLQ